MAIRAGDAPPGRYRVVQFAPDDDWGRDIYPSYFADGIEILAEETQESQCVCFRFLGGEKSVYPAAYWLRKNTLVAPLVDLEALNLKDQLQELAELNKSLRKAFSDVRKLPI